jgi:hypothetical protein
VIFNTMSHGEMPTHEEYDEAWSQTVEGSTFRFGNDPRLGSCELTQEELWTELNKANDEYADLLGGMETEDPEVVGSWLSSVLFCLGIEWV